MNNILSGTAAVALTLTGMMAHAACVDPRSAGQPNTVQKAIPMILNHAAAPTHEGIVGTWMATYSNGAAFIQWHSDGTEWENINFPVLSGNICLGSWVAADRWHYSRNHYGWLYTDGLLTGYFNETETDVLAADGNSYSGSNSTTLYDLTGAVTGGPFGGTSSATRITP